MFFVELVNIFRENGKIPSQLEWFNYSRYSNFNQISNLFYYCDHRNFYDSDICMSINQLTAMEVIRISIKLKYLINLLYQWYESWELVQNLSISIEFTMKKTLALLSNSWNYVSLSVHSETNDPLLSNTSQIYITDSFKFVSRLLVSSRHIFFWKFIGLSKERKIKEKLYINIYRFYIYA